MTGVETALVERHRDASPLRGLVARLRTAPEVTTLLGVVVLIWVLDPGPYDTRLATTALAFLIAGIGMNVLVGFVGLASVGHAGFLALGAYAWALTIDDVGIAGAVAAVLLVTSLSAALVGAFVLRFRSYYFALATLAFGFIVSAAIVSFSDLTGGSAGHGGVAALDLLGGTRETLLVVAGLLAVLVLLVQSWLRRSALGLQLLALRGNPAAASSLGVDRKRLELGAFVFSAVCAGIAGCLLAQITGYVSPSQFGFEQSVVLLVIPIVGGRGWVWAPIVGTAIAVGVPDYARFLGSGRLVAYGLILFLIAVLAPGGIRELADRVTKLGPVARGGGRG